MSRSRPLAFLASVAVMPLAAMAVAACGGGGAATVYRFIKDTHPGDVNGQGVTAFGAAWYALTPVGNQVSAQQPSSASDYGY